MVGQKRTARASSRITSIDRVGSVQGWRHGGGATQTKRSLLRQDNDTQSGRLVAGQRRSHYEKSARDAPPPPYRTAPYRRESPRRMEQKRKVYICTALWESCALESRSHRFKSALSPDVIELALPRRAVRPGVVCQQSRARLADRRHGRHLRVHPLVARRQQVEGG